ncbi:hypothetical protein BBK82_30605 [Lentzea guizhouensis]|uniref:Biotin carboxyl carrier protein of acetyl-CoA carboxylase n=1 Tax=Lentzea guizhouensis TaxID=1586287 RepID=A0A1B2HPU9_9PSEU|nr:biotin/lipoyl-containing protein [Lentzea guizhouensis]ANZ39746.1 hypothetical protein BBK82_30605 [Lentzea guizhouensis]
MSDQEVERLWAGVRELVDSIRGTTVTRLKVEWGGIAVEIEAAQHAAEPSVALTPASRPGQQDEHPGGHRHQVTAPLVGVFYRRPAPNEKAFVEPGDHVQVGQQVAIVEAMKMMNAVLADRAGAVGDILVADGEVVEFGQPLIEIG